MGAQNQEELRRNQEGVVASPPVRVVAASVQGVVEASVQGVVEILLGLLQ